MKKKVCLVTIFDTINFGTYLQAFATAITIKQLGADVEILWYERVHNRYRVPFEDKFHFLKIFTWLYAVITCNKSYFQKRACRKFVSRYINVSKLYYTYDELLEAPPDVDVYVTGSDQVWNTIHNSGIEKVYYLEFVPDNIKKCAFSASFGMDFWEKKYRNISRDLLARYNTISVREVQAVDLLAEVGIKSEKVVDPTFLLSKQEWLRYAKPYKHDKPYVLVYSVEWGECDAIISKTARQIATSIGGDVVEVNYVGRTKQIPDCDKRFFYATPEIFLSLMLGASFAVISSFHGTAFSLNLHIPFISVAPERFSSRIDSLLQQTQTISRKITTYQKGVVQRLISEQIDFDVVDRVLGREIKSSVNYIKEHIIS